MYALDNIPAEIIFRWTGNDQRVHTLFSLQLETLEDITIQSGLGQYENTQG